MTYIDNILQKSKHLQFSTRSMTYAYSCHHGTNQLVDYCGVIRSAFVWQRQVLYDLYCHYMHVCMRTTNHLTLQGQKRNRNVQLVVTPSFFFIRRDTSVAQKSSDLAVTEHAFIFFHEIPEVNTEPHGFIHHARESLRVTSVETTDCVRFTVLSKQQ